MPNQDPSHRRPPTPSNNFEMKCSDCGYQWISKSASCPHCQNTANRGDEMTKKVVDDSDLFKNRR